MFIKNHKLFFFTENNDFIHHIEFYLHRKENRIVLRYFFYCNE